MIDPKPRRAVADLLVLTACAQREADDLIADGRASTDRAEPSLRSSELVRRCYPANALAAGWARAAITRLVQHALPTAQMESVCVAVSEAVANAVTHAYSSDPGSVHFTAGLSGGEVIVLVADDGLGPRHPSATPGAGRGWPLIASHTDVFTVSQRAAGGTRIEMRWAVAAAAPLEPGG